MIKPRNQPTAMHKMAVFIVGAAALLYLFNPTLGVFEFLPDNIPFVGNVDEATATILLLSALGFFGYRIPNIFDRSSSNRKKSINTEDVEEGEIIRD